MALSDAAMDAKLAALEKAAAREEATAKAAAAKVIADKAAANAATAAVVAAGGSSTDKANRLPGETAAQANARITQGYKDQPIPELTVQGKAAGATIEFVRTGAGGVGVYKEVYPVGTPVPTTRTTSSGSTVSVSGTPITAKTVVSKVVNADGSTTVTYSDKSVEVIPKVVPGSSVIVPTNVPTVPSTNITVLKSLLSGLGYSKALVDSSTQYFMSLIQEGLDYDNIVALYTDAKDYTLKNGTKLTSPFYEQYGYLNEGLTQPKSAADLFHFVEGTKNLMKSYNVSSKFAEPDALKKYIANNVTIEKLDERIMAAKLRTITADPQYVNTLRELKYINKSEDLTDFFLDPKIGEAQLEINRKTASFATEALRRTNERTGIAFNADSLTKTAATLIGQGRTEAQIADIANQGYESIAQTLQPEVGLSNIFEGTNAANAQTIQTELEAEQFLGMESTRRKKLKELGTNIFDQSTGRSTGRTTTYSNYSSAGQL